MWFFYIKQACKPKAYQITYINMHSIFPVKICLTWANVRQICLTWATQTNNEVLSSWIVIHKQKVICKSKWITLLTSPLSFSKSNSSWIDNAASRTMRKVLFFQYTHDVMVFMFCCLAGLHVCVCWLFKYFSLFLQFPSQQRISS